MRSKQTHKRTILNLIRKNRRFSRPEIARALSLSFPAVTNLTKELISQGIIIESGYCEPEGGRRASYLVLNPAYTYSVGVEVSGSGIGTVIADFAGTVKDTSSSSFNSISSAGELLEKICSQIESIIDRNRDVEVKGIGIGIAGIVDRASRTSVRFPRLDFWKDVPVGKVVTERTGLAAFIENDVMAATLAELRYGRGISEDNFLLLHVGRGIRLGLVVDGRIFHGATGNPGEIGHTNAVKDGPICYCGNYGCLESIASPPAIVSQTCEALTKGVESSLRQTSSGDFTRIDIKSIFQAASGGDRLAANVLGKAAEAIGRSVANVANVFDPSALILSGIIRESQGIFFETLCRVFSSYVLQSFKTKPGIEFSQLTNCPCAVGAATLVFEEYFE